MAHKLNSDFLIDGDDPNNYNDKILDEKETRRRIMNFARSLGCEKELYQLLVKWDNKMRLCGNEEERKHMSELGNVEIFLLLKSAKHMGGESTDAKLVVNGKVVYSDKKPGDENLIITPDSDKIKGN